MILPTFINVNQSGIPTVKSTAVNVTATEVQFDFNNHRNIGRPFRGLIIINLAQQIPAGTSASLPIVFTASGSNNINLIGKDGSNVTVADIQGTGIYLVWHDSNILQLIA